MNYREFQQHIWSYYRAHKRSMPWRTRTTPYYVLVSEIMLQQTQVNRVQEIFPRFIKQFPSVRALASASQSEVLHAWQGLGYNRRALYLHRTAQTLVSVYKGEIPHDEKILQTLPGIGPSTAGSICAFAFNKPTVFVETNIRSVFLHHFFKNVQGVADNRIREVVEKTLDTKNPREWYWALMDYGTELKKKEGNPNKRSSHYAKQSQFQGSVRQLRGMILKTILATNKGLTLTELSKKMNKNKTELKKLLNQLSNEGFIIYTRGRYRVTSH